MLKNERKGMYENFKTKVELKKLSQELRQNIYWGNFPDKEAFTSETLGEHISAEQLPKMIFGKQLIIILRLKLIFQKLKSC